MSEPITNEKIGMLLEDLPLTRSITDDQMRLMRDYVAQNRVRDEKDAARAETLEEFKREVRKDVGKLRNRASTYEEDMDHMLNYLIDNFPRPEQKPSDLDRLVVALGEANKHARTVTRRILLCSSGDANLATWDTSEQRYGEVGRWRSTDEMIAHLEKQAPVSTDRVKEIIAELSTFYSPSRYRSDLLEELQRFADQKEGESDGS